MSNGVRDLAVALKELEEEFSLDAVSASKRIGDGHIITMRLSGQLLSLERDDGLFVLLNSELLGA